MTERERRRALAESLQDALDHPMRRATDIRAATETARRESAQRRRTVTVGLLLVSWGALGWLWLMRPSWVFSPPLRSVSVSQQSEEEGLRYGMYLQAARIREFEAEHGRLPETIAEAGEAEEGLHYAVAGTRWTLQGMVGDLRLELTSAMSVDSFRQGH